MPKPLILITAGKRNEVTAQGDMQTVISGVNVDYIHAVVRAGGAPILLPRMGDKEAIHAALDAADGLILTGGGDIHSLAYGEEPHPLSKYQDPVRDEMELEVTRGALERNLPLFGICRGMQLLNVALGGTLIQDIPSQVPGAVKHYSHGIETVLLHTVDIEEDSLLVRLMHTVATPVNSFHHQAPKDIGRGLRVSCRARDGVVEGIESSEGKPVLAVQFHPEECAAAYPRFQTFFDWLVREAADR